MSDIWWIASQLYLIMQKDWKYASQKPMELHNLKSILKLINYDKAKAICKYVYEKKDSKMRSFSMIRKYLDDLIEESTIYDPRFEIEEGYRYTNRVLKRKAYEEWRIKNGKKQSNV